MYLLFLNALKGLRKKKVQMACIIIMVMLSTAVYVGMNSAIDRLEGKYYDYLERQNVEDFSVYVNVDYTKDVSVAMLDRLRESELSNITAEESETLDVYRTYLSNESRDYDLALSYMVKNIFEKYGANYIIQNQILDSMKDKYDFTYELEKSKMITEDSILVKILPYDESGLNRSYLIEGKAPKAKDEVTILPSFAKANNIKIGDMYTLGETSYKVVGFTYAPDYIYPLLSFSMPIFDEKKNNIIYMTKEAYTLCNGLTDNTYAISYNYDVPRKFEISITNGEENESEKDPAMKIFEDEHIIMDMSTVTRLGRISALQLEFASNRLFAAYFLYLLLTISVVIIVIITKKRIDDERLQIGVLKSLGYNRFSIATSYLVYPIVGSLLGGVLGFLIGILVHGPIANILVSYYCVPLDHFQISLEYLKTAVLVPMGVLSILSYFIALFMLRKKPLSLLKEGSNLKINIFTRLCNRITSFLPFELRFKYSLAFRSLGKLLLVTLTSFCTGLLIVLILIGMNLFNDMIDKSFEGIEYKYMAALSGVTSQPIGSKDTSDYVLSATLPLTRIEDKNGKEKVLAEDEVTVSFTAIDTDVKYVHILDSKGKEINHLLDTKEGIIVNENAKELLHLSLNDVLTFAHENVELKYKIIGFTSEYMGYSVYINRDQLSHDIGFPNAMYSIIYSNDELYSNLENLSEEEASMIANVLSVPDLKRNIAKQMDRFNGSIYLVIAFASLMALIIIAVIANIIVEENKKTISLMKVMGYQDKKISNIILNIYTPFIVIAYFLAIPVMIQVLKAIVKALVGDIEMTIPIVITPSQIIIGLLGLVIAYYIAISLSKRVLKKIPLSVALKRE